jgi:hypothetical protein
MDNIINKVVKGFIVLIIAVSLVYTGFIVAYSSELGTDAALADKILNPIFAIALFLMVLALVVTLFFYAGSMVSNPKLAIRAIISLAIVAGIYLTSYMLSSDSIDGKVYEDFNITNSLSKLIGSGIVMVYILGGLSFLAIVFSGINKMLLNRQ